MFIPLVFYLFNECPYIERGSGDDRKDSWQKYLSYKKKKLQKIKKNIKLIETAKLNNVVELEEILEIKNEISLEKVDILRHEYQDNKTREIANNNIKNELMKFFDVIKSLEQAAIKRQQEDELCLMLLL